ncbi:MAG: T9SS type A sorting domain-containing protein [Sphingobacteriaceae bacterium]|nr:T9SS type A sorting domain-containing protein [Sphingobacteriaceae bacterium]
MKFILIFIVFLSLNAYTQTCNLGNYLTAYRIPVAAYPYFSVGSGITVSVQTNCGTLSNTSYNCGGSLYAGSSPAWWLNSAAQYIRFTFSAPVSYFTILVNGTNNTEVFYFAAATGAITISDYCTPDFTSVGATVTDNAIPANGSIFTSNNIVGSTTYTITHNGLGSGSRVTLLDCFVPTILPIELISFSAECVAKNVVNLKWETASENANKFFTVERSFDAEIWEEIQNIKSEGNSSQRQIYSYIDSPHDATNLYYRLRQTDLDGNYKHFAPVSVVNCFNKDIVSIYPNPANDEITITGENLNEIKIYNGLGFEIKRILTHAEKSTKINIKDLPKGFYYINIGEKSYKLTKE